MLISKLLYFFEIDYLTATASTATQQRRELRRPLIVRLTTFGYGASFKYNMLFIFVYTYKNVHA
jgi:hypothetical protein